MGRASVLSLSKAAMKNAIIMSLPLLEYDPSHLVIRLCVCFETTEEDCTCTLSRAIKRAILPWRGGFTQQRL
ncbi:hypothetical protein J6590_005669 [Homalodisca vitripennis]|nr:hypothetical protein J6590_005669 [Homalodisca vitripennis]